MFKRENYGLICSYESICVFTQKSTMNYDAQKVREWCFPTYDSDMINIQ